MTKRKCESTEEDRMKQLIICKLCHETLEDPIILTCGKTICSKHLLNEANNFKCGLCDNFHDKIADKFPVNQTVNELLEICDDYVNFNSIDLGPEYNLAKNQCKHLNDLIIESELLIKDPPCYIDDYFAKLRNKVDLSKEQLIIDIEEKHEQIINKLKEIEIKCKQIPPNKELIKKFEQTIKSTKEKLNKLTEKLESNLNRGDCCKDVDYNSKLSISALKYDMKKCQVALLDNKDFKFNSFQILGDLETNEVEIVDESRLEGTISFEIKDFSKLKHNFGKQRFIDQWFVVNNVPWLIGMEMNEIDNDIYLEILVKPLGLLNEHLKSNPINTEIIFKMIRTSGGSYGAKYTENFDHDFTMNTIKFISLKEIMNPNNSLYNKQTDSITAEALIRIKD